MLVFMVTCRRWIPRLTLSVWHHQFEATRWSFARLRFPISFANRRHQKAGRADGTRVDEEGEIRSRTSSERLPRVEPGPGRCYTAKLRQDVESIGWRLARQSIA